MKKFRILPLITIATLTGATLPLVSCNKGGGTPEEEYDLVIVSDPEGKIEVTPAKFKLNQKLIIHYNVNDPDYVINPTKSKITIGDNVKYVSDFERTDSTVTIPAEQVNNKVIKVEFVSAQEWHDLVIIDEDENIDVETERFQLNKQLDIEYSTTDDYEIDKTNSTIKIGDTTKKVSEFESTESAVTIPAEQVNSESITVKFVASQEWHDLTIIDEDENIDVETTRFQLKKQLDIEYSTTDGYEINTTNSTIKIGDTTYHPTDFTFTTSFVTIPADKVTSKNITVTFSAVESESHNLNVVEHDNIDVITQQFRLNEQLIIQYQTDENYTLNSNNSLITIGEVVYYASEFVQEDSRITIPAEKVDSINITVEFLALHDPINPLCFEDIEDGQPSTISYSSNIDANIDIECKIDDGEWQNWDGSNIELSDGHKLYVRNTLNNLSAGGPSFLQFISNQSSNFNVSGNVLSMINYGSLTEGVFYSLFMDCYGLINASNLIFPSDDIAERCYYQMFNGCTRLIAAPSLPATTLAYGCYDHMFSTCTSLETAPELPATTLAKSCYFQMFHNCRAMVAAPRLDVKLLETKCYQGMFGDCHVLRIKEDDQTLSTETLILDLTETEIEDINPYAEGMFNFCYSKEGCFTGTPQLGHKYYFEPQS